MNPVTDILFSVTWVVLFIFAMRSIASGWTIASEDTARPNGVWTTKLTKAQHPEMTHVKPGTELMVVKFSEPEPKDPLLKSLNKRVDELNEVWEDDDEDEGDGDIPARLIPK